MATALTAVLGYWLVIRPRSDSRPSASLSAQAGSRQLLPVPAGETGAAAQRRVGFQSGLQTEILPAATRTEPTAETRRLVASLANLDTSAGVISRETAELWKQGLRELIQHGAGAVPAIREFLERNVDYNYAEFPGADLLGRSSLRIALIDALQQIGGAEARAAMLETLHAATVPTEIALLARYVEQEAPGEYRQEILNSTREVLEMASKGQLDDWDMGPLFRVLQDYGDATSAVELEQRLPQWRYYAAISLAGLQGGHGIPMLIQQVREPGAMTSDLAFHLLAQASSRYPEAADALIERANQIPDSAWRKIAAGLAGDQFQLSQLPGRPGIRPGRPSGMQTFHVVSGNQSFHSVPLTTATTFEEVEKRQAIIAKLLSVTSSAAAVEALQGAEGLLASLGSAP